MEKIKQFIASEKGKDVLIILIVILVGLGSFELGRLSTRSTRAGGLKIEYPAVSVDAVTSKSSGTETGKTFFASNRGSKYYSIGCSGGKSIKQENRVYFASSGEAEKAGYELSSVCK